MTLQDQARSGAHAPAHRAGGLVPSAGVGTRCGAAGAANLVLAPAMTERGACGGATPHESGAIYDSDAHTVDSAQIGTADAS